MRVAFLTAGGIAPCLTSSIGMIMQEYLKISEDVKFIGYLYGYKGLLRGDQIIIPNDIDFNTMKSFGGSFLGNSRVKLTNIDDCIN